MSMEPISGSRTYVYNLCKAQQNYAKVKIICRYDKDNMKISGLVPIRLHKFYSWKWFKENPAAAVRSVEKISRFTEKYLQENKTDILNVQHITYSLASAKVAKNDFGLPVVVTSHGTCIYQNHDDPIVMDCLNGYVDKVISVSYFLKKYIEKKSKIKAKNIEVIHSGVDCKQFKTSNHSTLLQKKHGKFVLFYGRIEKEKGSLMLIDIAKNLPDNIKLVIIGKGKDSAELLEGIKTAKLSKKIEYLGFVMTGEFEKYVASAEVVIVPSVFEDPFPLAPLEAIASGTPVVVSKRGGMTELENFKGVIKVEPEAQRFSDGITKLLDFSAVEREELAERAAVAYSWSNVANKYLNVYESLM